MATKLTYQQMQDEALDNVAKSGVLTLQSGTTLATRMGTFVNRAQLWVDRKCDSLYYDFTSATVAGQQTYSFPSNLRRVFTLRLLDGLMSRKLTPILPWEMDQKIPNASSFTQARSEFYVPYSNTFTFQLFPIPDAVYTLELRASLFPSDMTNPADTSTLFQCDDAIVAYSTMFAFRWLQELKDASDWEAYANRIMKEVNEVTDDAQQYVDWAPTMEGFSVNGSGAYTGDYVNNPFIRSANLNTWGRF